MKIIVHKVGNKILGDGVKMSSELLMLDDDTRELLQDYFLGSFKSEETFQFYSDSYLHHNLVYHLATEIFKNEYEFIEASALIARHLYDVSENPRVQGGELFVVLFKAENENEVDKIGIFKTEKKESYLQIFPQDETFDVAKEQGISLAKIDKAVLIFNTDKETGYVLQVVDNNKNGDMYYWFEDFLKVKQRQDDYFQTQETMSVFKNFISKQMPVEYEVTKPDQAELLNRGLEFFKEKDQFNYDEFTAEVLQNENLGESFGNYMTDYEQEMQVSISANFAISEAAVKMQQRGFKSVVKLDKNFHIYVHGDRKLIENGQDEKGKFYKLYFENEA